MQCPVMNPVRPHQGVTDTPPPTAALSISETKLEIADGITVTEQGGFLFAALHSPAV